MNFKYLGVSLAFLALTGCASPSPYLPADSRHATGYSDERLAENRYRVTFTGNAATRRDTVEDFLLLRSAEVTRDAGYSWFEFDSRDTKADTRYLTNFGGWPGWAPGFGAYWHSWPYDPFGRDTLAMPITSYEAYAEIVLLTDEQARHEARALRASDVIARLGPPPQPAH